ncbi:MAG: radical SAM protein [Candidatus Aureabacteria bacterium]|nr:radical SAM protein [Candidatus Auribacterota bacterium]
MGNNNRQLLAGIASGSMAYCGPEQLHIDLTNACTLRCLCCWHRSPLLPKEGVLPHWAPGFSLPYEKVLQIIDDAAALRVKRIIYSGGGDPLCYPRLWDVLEATTSKGIEVILVSNFTSAEEVTLQRIISAGVARLVVSLWAADEATYNLLHPGVPAGTFKRILSLLSTLNKLRTAGTRPDLVIMNVICKMNVDNVETMVRLALDLGASEIWFQPIDVESEHLKMLLMNQQQIDGLIATLDKCKRVYQPLIKRGQENLLEFGEFIEKLRNSKASDGIFHSDVINNIPCYMGWAECRILANGDVIPCCKADRCPLGNILQSSFREIWLSEQYAEFRRKAKTLPKSDRYFLKINCAKICDDWWLNKQIHVRYQRMVLQHPGSAIS